MSNDLDFVDQKIRLKPTAKRTNRTTFFDDETDLYPLAMAPNESGREPVQGNALFLSTWGFRISKNDVYLVEVKASERVGLLDSDSERMGDHFSPQCARHWNTAFLLRAGMKREYVQLLRGDAIKEVVDIYFHVDPKGVKEANLEAIQQLGT